jgi:hypothetical protein
MTSPWTNRSLTGVTPAAASSRALSVRAWLNELFGTRSGLMSSAAS